MKFSERMGFVDIDDIIQTDRMSADLKNDIYNFCYSAVYGLGSTTYGFNDSKIIWRDFFHKSLSDISGFDEGKRSINIAYKQLEFYEVYDFLEYVVQSWVESNEQVKDVNRILENNHSAYRVISDQLEPITSKTDVKTLKRGLRAKIDDGHLEKALIELSKRKNRNNLVVMKESIDAVEFAAKKVNNKLFGGKSSDSFSKVCNNLSDNGFFDSHPAYVETLKKLYGYSSDGGIRHPKERNYHPDLADATFMVSMSAAFISMLKAKFSHYQDK